MNFFVLDNSLFRLHRVTPHYSQPQPFSNAYTFKKQSKRELFFFYIFFYTLKRIKTYSNKLNERTIKRISIIMTEVFGVGLLLGQSTLIRGRDPPRSHTIEQLCTSYYVFFPHQTWQVPLNVRCNVLHKQTLKDAFCRDGPTPTTGTAVKRIQNRLFFVSKKTILLFLCTEQSKIKIFWTGLGSTYYLI